MKPPLPDRLPIVSELERLFVTVNKGLFGSDLSFPPFVFQPEKKVLLRFIPESFHIVIGSKFAITNYDDLKCALLHEMVHIKNYMEDVTDCTSNQYHNRNFLKEALDVGFYVCKHKTRGWGITKFKFETETECREPDKKLIKKRTKVLSSISLNRSILCAGQKEIKIYLQSNPRKSYFLKYECGCLPPHNSIRSGRRPDGGNPLELVCSKCGYELVCVENEFQTV